MVSIQCINPVFKHDIPVQKVVVWVRFSSEVAGIEVEETNPIHCLPYVHRNPMPQLYSGFCWSLTHFTGLLGIHPAPEVYSSVLHVIRPYKTIHVTIFTR